MAIQTEEEFQQKLENSDKIVFIFSASWCKSCEKLRGLIDEDSTLNVWAELILKVDADACSDLVDRMKIHSLPETLFCCNGKIVNRYVGSKLEDFIEKMQLLMALDDAMVSIDAESQSGGTEPLDTVITAIPSTFSFPSVSVSFEPGFIDVNFLTAVGLGNMSLTPTIIIKNQASIAANSLEIQSMFEKEAYMDLRANLTGEDIIKLYEYRVPTISPDGTCSNIYQLAKKPFNLAINAYYLPLDTELLSTHPMTTRLIALNRAIDLLYEVTHADWIGIYRLILSDGNPTLMKEAYRGEPSRALFPVTADFAKKSTNSWVGLTGQVRIIENTRSREQGVSYYECDGKVQSELCVPILRAKDQTTYEVIGIIDLESWNPCHFTSEIILQVLYIALDLGQNDVGMSLVSVGNNESYENRI